MRKPGASSLKYDVPAKEPRSDGHTAFTGLAKWHSSNGEQHSAFTIDSHHQEPADSQSRGPPSPSLACMYQSAQSKRRRAPPSTMNQRHAQAESEQQTSATACSIHPVTRRVCVRKRAQRNQRRGAPPRRGTRRHNTPPATTETCRIEHYLTSATTPATLVLSWPAPPPSHNTTANAFFSIQTPIMKRGHLGVRHGRGATAERP